MSDSSLPEILDGRGFPPYAASLLQDTVVRAYGNELVTE